MIFFPCVYKPRVRGRGGFGPGLGFSRGLTERKKSCGVEFFPGRGTPVGWAAFPAGNGLTEQGLSGEEISPSPSPSPSGDQTPDGDPNPENSPAFVAIQEM
jgi:hypothetical protein